MESPVPGARTEARPRRLTNVDVVEHLPLESMILAQNERWQRALYMQVERETPLRRGSRAAKG